MRTEDYADRAEAVREQLTQQTLTRGHSYDDAEDLVQSAIVSGLSYANRFKTDQDILKFLKTCIANKSINEFLSYRGRPDNIVRIDDVSAETLNEALAVDTQDETDMKLDIERALKGLNDDDRELARFLFLEGFTYDQTFPLFADVFPSRDALFQHVTNVLKPLLRDVLADYERKPAPPVTPLYISQPSFTVYEQVFGTRGYTLKPVTAKVAHHGACIEAKTILERRYREDELDSRYDWALRDSKRPIRAKLKHLGQRQRTRLFTVRKKVA